MHSTVKSTKDDEGSSRNVSNAVYPSTTPSSQILMTGQNDSTMTSHRDLSVTPGLDLSTIGSDFDSSGVIHALLSSVTFKEVQAVCFSMIFVLGIIGNGLLLGLNAYRRSKKQAVTQIFMCALSLADVGHLLSDTWVKALMASGDTGWTLGAFMCKLNSFWKMYSADSSVLTLAVISLDR